SRPGIGIDNERHQMWVGETDWVYQGTFTVSDEFLAYQQIYLRCHGLDTLATIQVNDAHIGQTDNMFRTYEFDVKPHLVVGENIITITFDAPATYARRMDEEKGEMAAWTHTMRINSGAWIRKEPCNFGWDWGPKMVTSGIWRDIELVAFDTACLSDIHILQDHRAGNVKLTVNVEVEAVTDANLTINVEVIDPDRQTVIASAEAVVGETAVLDIPNPQLWWPNGMGQQPLYTVRVTLLARETVLDSNQKRIGLRTLKLERHPDQWGESFYFSCNGVPFFAKGANWIPISPYPGSVSNDDYRLFVRAAADANMNMLRVWGGGIYEDDVFYDLCDELGITLWQDFIFSCGTYPSFDADFMANVKAEAEDNVRRLRHHASLALWCGNNEIEQGLPHDEGWLESMSWDDYRALFDKLLPNIVRELDGQTDYWPGSPHSPCGDRDFWQNPDCGDTHLWMVWHGRQPFEWYRTRPDRFCSEFGFQSFPEPRVVNEFTEPQDRNLTSYVMEHHQRSPIGNSTIVHYMLDWFQMPESFEGTVWLSQILQGMAMKYAVEHWRRNMPRTMGTLYWQLNDMWPAPSWASIDWKGNWKALHYMAKRFYAPLLLSGLEHPETSTIDLHVTSDLLHKTEGIIRWTITDAQGSILDEGDIAVSIPANANTFVETLDVARHVATHTTRDVLVWLELDVAGEIVSENLVVLNRLKHFELPEPNISLAVNELDDGRYAVTLLSDAPALYVWLEHPEATFSDNFFHLRPEQEHTVYVSAVDIDALRVKSLVDTF
ncbi:MAG: hypothetical protein L0154_18455, partial [Chloroflexi bacterium]|nr:hypothetical protein [Chloroflexota bacterium]